MKPHVWFILLGCIQTAATSWLNAQGTILFNNSDASRVIDGEYFPPVFPPPETYVAGLYYSSDLTDIPNPGQDPDDFSLAAVTPVSPSPDILFWGLFNGGIVPIPDKPAGSQVLIQIRVWDASFDTYEDSLRYGTSSDKSGGWSELLGPVTLGGGILPPNGTSVLLTQPIYVNLRIPEPRLGVLAAAALALGLARRFLKRH